MWDYVSPFGLYVTWKINQLFSCNSPMSWWILNTVILRDLYLSLWMSGPYCTGYFLWMRTSSQWRQDYWLLIIQGLFEVWLRRWKAFLLSKHEFQPQLGNLKLLVLYALLKNKSLSLKIEMHEGESHIRWLQQRTWWVEFWVLPKHL